MNDLVRELGTASAAEARRARRQHAETCSVAEMARQVDDVVGP
jgi:hypothetical protein